MKVHGQSKAIHDHLVALDNAGKVKKSRSGVQQGLKKKKKEEII